MRYHFFGCWSDDLLRGVLRIRDGDRVRFAGWGDVELLKKVQKCKKWEESLDILLLLM